MGNYIDAKPTEATLERQLIITYIKRLFRRAEFPQGVYVVLADCLVASMGDIVWPDIDSEHPYDFVPFTRIDNLAVNLPTKEEFLQQLGVAKFEDVPPEAEDRFWSQYEFQFADKAENLKLMWK
jgi:hypothetical protein